jgi:4-hydroxybenzoate polyprenyltransferase
VAWLRLIRWKNLIIIFLTQGVAWFCVIRPLYERPWVSLLTFLLVSTSTVLIAAAGYIINDYFDIRIDAINKPDEMVLDKIIPHRLAIIVHSVMNVVALGLAAIIAIPEHHPEWLLIQIVCTLLLWRYSTTWKRQFMIGNLVVALMTALSVLVLMVYEPALQYYLRRAAFYHPQVRLANVVSNPAYILIVYAAFAFILTWMREIVKDMEDFKGDDAEGCITMPIKWGLLRSTRFVQGLAIVSMLLLVYVCLRLWLNASVLSISSLYILFALILPLLMWTIRLPGRATRQHYHIASRRLKVIMVVGILSLLLLSAIHYA